MPIPQLPVLWKHGQSLGDGTGVLGSERPVRQVKAAFRLVDVLIGASENRHITAVNFPTPVKPATVLQATPNLENS